MGLKNDIQDNIFNACEWAKTWEMVFNTDKCKTLYIGKDIPNKYHMKDHKGAITRIQNVDNEKDLGVIFDNKLKFHNHIISKVNIANRNLGIIKKTFIYMNKRMFLNSFKSLIRPHLEYYSIIWNPRYKKDTILLENVKRRATQMLNILKKKVLYRNTGNIRFTYIGIQKRKS